MTCWQRLPPIRSCNARRTSAAVFPGCFPSTLRQPVWDPSRDTLLPSQERALDQRCRALAPIAEGGLFRRLALVPARGLAQPGWFTSMFLHFGWLHFLGNMVFLLFVGRFLEDRWGRLFFAVFYVAGGVAAAVAHAALTPKSMVMMGGASGAVAACIGAFVVRFGARPVLFFYMLLPFRPFMGRIALPAALWGAGWALEEGLSLWAQQTGGNPETGVAFMAHLGGFAFGAVVAGVVWASGLEARILRRDVASAIGRKLEKASTDAAPDAPQGHDLEDARSTLKQAVRGDDATWETALHLAVLEWRGGRKPEAARAAQLVVGRALETQDAKVALQAWQRLIQTIPADTVPLHLRMRLAQTLETLGKEGRRPLVALYKTIPLDAPQAPATWSRVVEILLEDLRDPQEAIQLLRSYATRPELDPPLRARLHAQFRSAGALQETLRVEAVQAAELKEQRARVAAERAEAERVEQEAAAERRARMLAPVAKAQAMATAAVAEASVRAATAVGEASSRAAARGAQLASDAVAGRGFQGAPAAALPFWMRLTRLTEVRDGALRPTLGEACMPVSNPPGWPAKDSQLGLLQHAMGKTTPVLLAVLLVTGLLLCIPGITVVRFYGWSILQAPVAALFGVAWILVLWLRRGLAQRGLAVFERGLMMHETRFAGSALELVALQRLDLRAPGWLPGARDGALEVWRLEIRGAGKSQSMLGTGRRLRTMAAHAAALVARRRAGGILSSLRQGRQVTLGGVQLGQDGITHQGALLAWTGPWRVTETAGWVTLEQDGVAVQRVDVRAADALLLPEVLAQLRSVMGGAA